jgi:hypothetical protein
MKDDNMYEIAQTMKTYGGGFMRALAEALIKADTNNQRKIMKTWEREIYHLLSIKKIIH